MVAVTVLVTPFALFGLIGFWASSILLMDELQKEKSLAPKAPEVESEPKWLLAIEDKFARQEIDQLELERLLDLGFDGNVNNNGYESHTKKSSAIDRISGVKIKDARVAVAATLGQVRDNHGVNEAWTGDHWVPLISAQPKGYCYDCGGTHPNDEYDCLPLAQANTSTNQKFTSYLAKPNPQYSRKH
jgi:hypothetical protein